MVREKLEKEGLQASGAAGSGSSPSGAAGASSPAGAGNKENADELAEIDAKADDLFV